MKGTKFKWILGFLLLMIIGLSGALYYYNKPHVNVEKTQAVFVLTAENLISEYQNSESETNRKYSEQVIQIKGKVHEVSVEKGNTVLILKNDDQESSVICNMLFDQADRVGQLKKGDQIAVKGVCTGYLMDVIMVRCILVE